MVLVHAREVDEDADDVLAERVAQEAQQRVERRAVGVGVGLRAPRVRHEADGAVARAQRRRRRGGRQEDLEALDALAGVELL